MGYKRKTVDCDVCGKRKRDASYLCEHCFRETHVMVKKKAKGTGTINVVPCAEPCVQFMEDV